HLVDSYLTTRTSQFMFLSFMIRRTPRYFLFPSRRSSDLPFIIYICELFNRFFAFFGTCKFPRSPINGSEIVQTVPTIQRFNWFRDRKSTRLNSSHVKISYAVFCLKKKRTHL